MSKTYTHNSFLAHVATHNNGIPTLGSTKNALQNLGQNSGNENANGNYKNLMKENNKNQNEAQNNSMINNQMNGQHMYQSHPLGSVVQNNQSHREFSGQDISHLQYPNQNNI